MGNIFHEAAEWIVHKKESHKFSFSQVIAGSRGKKMQHCMTEINKLVCKILKSMLKFEIDRSSEKLHANANSTYNAHRIIIDYSIPYTFK